MGYEPYRTCTCGCAWKGGPECWNCHAWVAKVSSPMLRDVSGPREDAVGEPLTL